MFALHVWESLRGVLYHVVTSTMTFFRVNAQLNSHGM